MGLLSLLVFIHCDIHTRGCLGRYLMSPSIGEGPTETYPWGKDNARGPGETYDILQPLRNHIKNNAREVA